MAFALEPTQIMGQTTTYTRLSVLPLEAGPCTMQSWHAEHDFWAHENHIRALLWGGKSWVVCWVIRGRARMAWSTPQHHEGFTSGYRFLEDSLEKTEQGPFRWMSAQCIQPQLVADICPWSTSKNMMTSTASSAWHKQTLKKKEKREWE